MGLGRTSLQLKLSLVLGGATVALVAAGAPFGVTAVSAALAVGVGAVCGLYVVQLARSLGMSPLRLLAAFTPAAVASAAMAAALMGLRLVLTEVDTLGELGLLVVAGAVVYGAVILGVWSRTLLRDLAGFATAQADRPEDAVTAPPELSPLTLGEVA
jgi:PST family polysaccharide transporter